MSIASHYRRNGLTACCALLGLMMASPAYAQEEVPEEGDTLPPVSVAPSHQNALSFQVENDLFGEGSDKHYTNGLRISYLFSPERTPGFAEKLRRGLPWLANEGDLLVVMAWGQNIYTPEDITIPELIPTDRPYAGWLYTELGLSVRKDGGRRDNFLISLGMVGPASLARETQTRWHDIINTTRPEGWSNQLRNEPALMVMYEREWVGKRMIGGNGFEVDVSPRLGMALGNVFTYASAGAMFRFGYHLPNDSGVPRIRPSLPGSAYFEARRGKLDWYLFGGAEVRAVARNIFLDGNTWRNSHSVDKRILVWDLQMGAAMTLGFLNMPTRITYNFVYRRREFHGQPRPDRFGSISLSFIY